MTLNNVLIQEITLTQAASLVTFSNISQEYTDLRIVASMRDSGDNIVRFSMGFNSTSKTTTTRRILYGTGSGSASTTGSTNTSVGYGSTRSSGTANTFGNAEIYIPNYTSSNYKSFSVDSAEENNATDAIMSITAGVWESTAAITSLSIICDAPNFAAGSSFTLYGISKLGVTPTQTPKATGGDIIKNDGTYWYHAFLSTGAFIPQQSLSCEVFQVAGGGGSANDVAGGGGAGGVTYAPTIAALSNTTYAIAIGAGGAGATNPGGSGGNSTSFGITALGGGGSSAYNTTAPSGGSGGGGSHRYSAGGSATQTSGANYTGYGNAGGAAVNSGSTQGGGGGGGAIGAGGTSTGNPGAGGNGGAPITTFSAWASATGTGVSGAYAGGGGGASQYSSGGTASGGGTAGTTSGNANPATANTGGGAGGGRDNGANGGSGIVIVRYAMA